MGYRDDSESPGKRTFCRVIALAVVLAVAVGLGLPVVAAEAAAAGRWRDAVGDIGPRYGHVAVRLRDGRVLVAGGLDDIRKGKLSSAALFDPSTGVTPTASMSVPRYRPSATLLGDGSVLVAGGDGGETSAERYLPTIGRWIPAGAMSTSRWGHTATLLRDGRLLVAGGATVTGCCTERALPSTEIYNPVSNSWSPAHTMRTARYSHTATLLTDGRVLVVGGNGSGFAHPQLASAEIYDPSTDAWTSVPDMSVARVEHTATALADGPVLVVGGADGDTYWSSTEIFDPKAMRWTRTADMVAGRAGHTATAWEDGRIFVAGGLFRYSDPLATAEIYDPETGRWDEAAPMRAPRYLHTATLLADGRSVAFVGGWDGQSGATGDIAVYQR
jgi:Kelch motif/Galactose oxidase, central domain